MLLLKRDWTHHCSPCHPRCLAGMPGTHRSRLLRCPAYAAGPTSVLLPSSCMRGSSCSGVLSNIVSDSGYDGPWL